MVGVLAVSVALAGTGVQARAKRFLPYVNRVAGGLLVVAGAYVAYYGIYELRIIYGSGATADPVIDAAAVQQWLSGTVDRIGALPLIGVPAALVLGAVILGRRVRSSRR